MPAAPLPDGWVTVARRSHRGGRPRPRRAAAVATRPRPRRLLPGLVNAHTHLELSWLRGRCRRRRASALGRGADGAALRPTDARDDAGAMRRRSTTRSRRARRRSATSPTPLVSRRRWRESRLRGVVFHELLGFSRPTRRRSSAPRARTRRAPTPRVGLRTSRPRAVLGFAGVFAAIGATRGAARARSRRARRRVARGGRVPADGAGPLARRCSKRSGRGTRRWTPPACGPVEYLYRLGVVARRCSSCTACSCTDAELARLAARGATLVTCPRSNVWVGVGRRRSARFYRLGRRASPSAPTAWRARPT